MYRGSGDRDRPWDGRSSARTSPPRGSRTSSSQASRPHYLPSDGRSTDRISSYESRNVSDSLSSFKDDGRSAYLGRNQPYASSSKDRPGSGRGRSASPSRGSLAEKQRERDDGIRADPRASVSRDGAGRESVTRDALAGESASRDVGTRGSSVQDIVMADVAGRDRTDVASSTAAGSFLDRDGGEGVKDDPLEKLVL
jgi:hypothetical protein